MKGEDAWCQCTNNAAAFGIHGVMSRQPIYLSYCARFTLVCASENCVRDNRQSKAGDQSEMGTVLSQSGET